MTESDLEKLLEEKSAQEDDAFIQLNDTDYLKYINERPYSHGLFGENGAEDLVEVSKEIKNCKSFVWRGIVSLREDEAEKLGYLEKQQWQDMLRKKVPDMASEMGIGIDNIRWSAAVHMEKGHPHAHIMFWEKEPKLTLGTIPKGTLNAIKKLFTDEVYEEERFLVLTEKNLLRDTINELIKGNMNASLRYLTKYEDDVTLNTPPRIYDENEKSIANMLQDLSLKIPEKGRVVFKLMPEDVKAEINNISQYFLQQPDFIATLAKSQNAVERLTDFYSSKPEDIEKAKENNYNDIINRMNQIILKAAFQLKKQNNFSINKKLSEKAVGVIKNITSEIKVVRDYEKDLSEISKTCIKLGVESDQIRELLKQYLFSEKATYKDASINNIIDRELQSFENEAQNEISVSKNDTEKYLNVLKLLHYDEKIALDMIDKIYNHNMEIMIKKLTDLRDLGVLGQSNNKFHLVSSETNEYRNAINLKNNELELLSIISKNVQGEGNIISLEEIIKTEGIKDVVSKNYRKPFDTGIIKFDLIIEMMMGKNSKITLAEVERKTYSKYNKLFEACNKSAKEKKYSEYLGKAEKETGMLVNRFKKLAILGYMSYNKEDATYSFTREARLVLDDLRQDAMNGKKKEWVLYKNTIPIETFSTEINNEEEAITEKKECLSEEEHKTLNKKLDYFELLGYLKKVCDGKYELTEKYTQKFAEDKSANESDMDLESTINIDKMIIKLLQNNNGEINIDELKKESKIKTSSMYVEDTYKGIQADYESLKKYHKITDVAFSEKIAKNICNILLASNVGYEEVYAILQNLNVKSKLNIEIDKLERIIKDTYEKSELSKAAGNIDIMSMKDWKTTFEAFGIKEKNIPRWMYAGSKQGLTITSMVSSLWKSVWSELERSKRQSVEEAEFMKNEITKQQALQSSKEVMKENIKKINSASLYQEEELER